MARITIEDCLKRIPNRFAIVNLAAKRVREIREGSEYLVSSPKNEDIVVALREIAAGKVSFEKQTENQVEPEEAAAKAVVDETTDTADEIVEEAAPLETAEEDEPEPAQTPISDEAD